MSYVSHDLRCLVAVIVLPVLPGINPKLVKRLTHTFRLICVDVKETEVAGGIAESEAEARRVRRQRKLHLLQIPEDHVMITNELLGKGGFGSVYIADYNGRNAAAKVKTRNIGVWWETHATIRENQIGLTLLTRRALYLTKKTTLRLKKT